MIKVLKIVMVSLGSMNEIDSSNELGYINELDFFIIFRENIYIYKFIFLFFVFRVK